MLGSNPTYWSLRGIRDDIIRHVFWYYPKRVEWEHDKDVELIVSNAIGYERVVKTLNPSAFAAFCASAFHELNVLRDIYQKCENGEDLGPCALPRITALLTTPTTIEWPACAARAFAKAGLPPQVYETL